MSASDAALEALAAQSHEAPPLRLLQRDEPIVDLAAEIEIRELAERGTDLDNAAFFARRMGGKLLYNFAARSWMIYDGQRWRLDHAGAAMRLAKDVAREMQRIAASVKDDSLRVKAVKHALGTQSRKRLEAMLYLAQSDLPASSEQFDADPYAFNVLNGTLNLRTRELRPHSAADFVSKLAPVTFDADATCPRWEQFVDEIMGGNAELVEFLQRFIGLAMTGVVIEHLFAIFYGSGSNGKSTLLDVLSRLLGDYGAVVDPALFVAQQNSQGPSPELVRLNGVRFVAANEMPEGGRFAEGRMKRLTGGDRIPARNLFSGVVEMRPSWKICIATNCRPIVRDTSEGFWRRVRLIPFEAVFAGPQRDERLREKLVDELPGILNWALHGCRRWQEHGLGEPPKINAATQDYRADSDLIGSFICEQCIVAPEVQASTSGLYAAFAEFAKASGERTVPTARAFRSDLVARGYRNGRVEHGRRRVFVGIGLRDERG